MQQAEANARNQMNARGLINSSMGITAGQSAVIQNALPNLTKEEREFLLSGATSAEWDAAFGPCPVCGSEEPEDGLCTNAAGCKWP